MNVLTGIGWYQDTVQVSGGNIAVSEKGVQALHRKAIKDNPFSKQGESLAFFLVFFLFFLAKRKRQFSRAQGRLYLRRQ